MSDGDATINDVEAEPESRELSELSIGRTGHIWASQALGFARRTLRDVARSWTVLGVAIGLPPIMYLLLTATREFDPVTKGLFAVGIAVLGAMIASLTVFGSQLAIDLDADRFIAYRSMSVHPSADLAGRMAAGLVIAALALTVGIGVGILDGAPIGLRGVLPVAASVAGFLGVSVVLMVVAVPIVVAANNEQYAQFALSLLAVFAFMLTGYNGMIPSVAVLDESTVELLPNVLATREIAARLVTAEGVASVEFAGAGGRLAPLAVYAALAAIVGVFLVRWQLYERVGSR